MIPFARHCCHLNHSLNLFLLIKKRYAPGNATSDVRKHPLYDSKQWTENVLPTLSGDQLPQQCTQVGGEVMYLPAAWAHLTLNQGASIGFGAQAAWTQSDSKLIQSAADGGDPEASQVLGRIYDRVRERMFVRLRTLRTLLMKSMLTCAFRSSDDS